MATKFHLLKHQLKQNTHSLRRCGWFVRTACLGDFKIDFLFKNNKILRNFYRLYYLPNYGQSSNPLAGG